MPKRNNQMRLGELLRRYRRDMGLTQKDIGDKIGRLPRMDMFSDVIAQIIIFFGSSGIQGVDIE